MYIVQGEPKNGTIIVYLYNFTKYWLIFKTFSLSELGDNLQ